MPDMPSVAPEPAPLQTPDIPSLANAGAMGGELAGAIGEAAGGVQQRMLQRHEIDLRNQYEDELTQGQIKLANARATLSQQIEAIQRDPELNLADYKSRVSQAFDDVAGTITDGVTNSRVARTLTGQLGQMRAEYGAQAADWQTAQQAGMVAQGAKQLSSTIEGQAYGVDDPAQLATLNNQWADYVHGLADQTPEQRFALVSEQVGKNALAMAQGLAERDPEKARALLDNGWFGKNGVPGNDLHVVDRMIRLSQDRKDAEAEAARRAAQQGVLTNAESMLRTIDQNGSVPLPMLLAMRDAVGAMPGHEALRDRLSGAVTDMNVQAKFGSKAPAVTAAAAAALQKQVDQAVAEGKPVPLEVGRELTSLTKLAQQQTTAARDNPWSLAAKRGVNAVPLNWGDPNIGAALDTRLSQRDQLSGLLGVPVGPLQPAEAAQFKTVLQTGSAPDQLHALSIIAGAEARHPGATAAIFNQVSAPPEMRMAAAMMGSSNPHGVQDAADMLAGYHLVGSGKAHIAQEIPHRLDTQILDALGGSLGANPGALGGNPQYIGVVAAAKALYVNEMAQRGAPLTYVDPTVLKRSVNRALGGYTDAQGVQRGGLGAHNGPMILPGSTSQQEFDAKATAQLPAAMQAAGVFMPHQMFAPEHTASLKAYEDANPKRPDENLWQYEQRIGHLQWEAQNAHLSDPNRVRPTLPGNAQFRYMGGDNYKIWTGSGYLADPKGRAAIWNYRTGKVVF